MLRLIAAMAILAALIYFIMDDGGKKDDQRLQKFQPRGAGDFMPRKER